MGRRKIEIQPITRKNGLFKKAYELGVLCSVDVAVIVFEEKPGHHLKLYQYGSSDISDIIQRHLRHQGEKDTLGPSDFLDPSSTLKDEVGEGDEDEADEEPDDSVLPSVRGSKRHIDGRSKQVDAEYNEIGDVSPRQQNPTRLLPFSMPTIHHHHPISSDRLRVQNKKPRLGISSGGSTVRSRSADNNAISGASGQIRSSREYHDYDHNYGLVHTLNSPQNAPLRQHDTPYIPSFPSSRTRMDYHQSGTRTTPPRPNLIPISSQADFAASAARMRGMSGSGLGVLSPRNVYGGYGDNSSGPGGAGPNNDIFAAFLDAEDARATVSKLLHLTSTTGVVELIMVLSTMSRASRGPLISLRAMFFTCPHVHPRHSFKVNAKPVFVLKGRYVSTATARSEEVEDTNRQQLPTFDTLEGVVSKNILDSIKKMNITTMSPVQAEVFPLLPNLARPYNPQEPSTAPPRDLLVKAKTGTGKTLGFLVPAIEARLKSIAAHGAHAAREAGKENDASFTQRAAEAFARKSVGTLVISPTRELATQIAREAQKLTGNFVRENRDFGVRLLVGGESRNGQLRQFASLRNDIVVATPGRLRDLMDSKESIREALSYTQVLVLDEADTLLDMGFRPDIDAIEKDLAPKPERQTFLFSATVSPAIQNIARATLSPNHKFVDCVPADASPVHAHIPQYVTVVSDLREHLPHIVRVIAHDQLTNPGASKIIIFLPTTKMTQLFSTMLRDLAPYALPAAKTSIWEIHSKKTMEQRTRASNKFREDKSGATILVTSDVSARGVDYPAVTRVIQVGVPSSGEQYIHRVGRTGRAGNTRGRGDLILMPFEQGSLRGSLNHIPLQPLSIKALTEEVTDLAREHDSDPALFVKNAPPTQTATGRAFPTRNLFVKQVAPVVEEIEPAYDHLLTKLDARDIHEVFMSNIGFYATQSGNLRTSVNAIVENLQDWTVKGLGLKEPPYVSEALLAKFGAGGFKKRSDRDRPFGARRRSDYPVRDSHDHYRGRDDSRGFSRSRGDAYGHSRDRGDSYGQPRERSGGYGYSRDRGDSYGQTRERSGAYGQSRERSESYGGSRTMERDSHSQSEYGATGSRFQRSERRGPTPTWLSRGRNKKN
ncbi:hypothetical protein H0H93_006455 [Arthromyces matolae]|nr:hypothetical protein H0H93_006455 [Arthromyces matolae]